MHELYKKCNFIPKRKTIMYRITLKEQNKIKKECGFAALYLLNAYVERYEHAVNDDKTMAKLVDMPLRTVQRARWALTKYNYFYKKIIASKKDKIEITYLGKECVLIAKFFEQLFGEECNSITKVIRKYPTKELAEQEINIIIKNANLSEQDTQDLLNLFGNYFIGLNKKKRETIIK